MLDSNFNTNHLTGKEIGGIKPRQIIMVTSSILIVVG